MTQFTKQVLAFLLLSVLSVPLAAAKEDPHELLGKSFQQANLWTQGPIKVVAKMSMPKPGGGNVEFEYTLSWANPEKWRAEWTTGGFDQVTVLNGGKLSYFNSQPNQLPLVQPLQFEAAVEGLDAGNPAGPYTIPPLAWQKAKIDIDKKKVNNVDAKCMTFGDPHQTFCIDPANAHLLSLATTIGPAEVGSFEYSDYTAVGNASYPQTIKVFYAKNLLAEGKITVTRNEKFDEKLFAAPDKSTTTDFVSCPEVGTNFGAPELTRAATPKLSDALRKEKKYGLVWVLGDVNKEGAVQKAVVIAGDPELNGPATEAAQQDKYTPYQRCGKAVDFKQVMVIPFLPPKQQDNQGFNPNR